MIFQDNVLKEHLKNVYFIAGTPCGRKTTISRKLAKRHNFLVYDIDEQFAKHQRLSNTDFQPAMNKKFVNADEFFGRTVEEYKNWLIENTREQLDFVLLDLIRLSQNQKVICDCHLTVKEADKLTQTSRIVFLIKEPSNLIDDYCNRPDHKDFNDYINSTSDTEEAKAICNATLKSLAEKKYNDIKNSNHFWIERTENSTVEETLHKVEKHFGLIKMHFNIEALEIRKVDKNTELAEKLIRFVESFSWIDVKDHMLGVLQKWAFTDWETVFTAIIDDKIVGITTLMKTDYYPSSEIYPWISSIFVSEDYRGYRISEKMIDFANEYAKENGFDRTYIPSSHIGLYEKLC